MDDLERHKEWLRARGIQNPSEDEARLFKKRMRRGLQRRASVLEFLVFMWMNSRIKHSGTRSWLKHAGMQSPSEEDLTHFTRKMTRAVFWRVSIVLGFVLAWFVFLWWAGLQPFSRPH
jgi:hypothetical protein